VGVSLSQVAKSLMNMSLVLVEATAAAKHSQSPISKSVCPNRKTLILAYPLYSYGACQEERHIHWQQSGKSRFAFGR